MKKTVSWSAETIRDRKSTKISPDDDDDSAKTNAGGGGNNNKNGRSSTCGMTKRSKSAYVPSSSSASASTTASNSSQVNERIQRMIAMQKAQNTTMRQLINNGGGSVSMASPSGLTALVMTEQTTVASSSNVAANEEAVDGSGPRGLGSLGAGGPTDVGLSSELTGRATMELMKPPISTSSNLSQARSEISRQDVVSNNSGIHFQGPPHQNHHHRQIGLHTHEPQAQQAPIRPYSQAPCSSPELGPRFHPEMADSPMSYNSVLDQYPHQNPLQQPAKGHNTAQQHDHGATGQQEASSQQVQQASLLAERIENPDVATTHKHSLNLMGHHLLGHDSKEKRMEETNNLITMSSQQQQQQKSNISNFAYNTQLAAQHSLHRQGPMGEVRMPQLLHQHRDAAQDGNVETILRSSLVQHTGHDFDYGSNTNAAVGGPHYYDIHNNNNSKAQLESRIHRRRRGILRTILCYPCQSVCFLSEQLTRSICFGAIDGMLTGSGILSACVSLGLLEGGASNFRINYMVIALTLSSTFADGVCMAIGHVWSTHLVANAAHIEKEEELRNFQFSRSDAKARLVDALLLQGMLKIDAMSLADTLEGYPDLFVGALLGSGLCAGENDGGTGGLANGGGGMTEHRMPFVGDGALQQHQQKHHGGLSYGAGIPQSKYCDVGDFHYVPPDEQDLSSGMLSESTLEGILLMLSFGCFSIIPSLFYSIVPPMVNLVNENYIDTSHHALVLALCLSALVMFLLGAWKSSFYSSNWFMFGLKNMGVLAICAGTAYSLGAACGILGHSGQ
eukprot:CAMPEP_0181123462 /NCGR_PEP_ID=MMETSP1071-20121207/25917_1 /TAXON_ID=35127 /ORGANISM="Thalassiosira sp., Strain NH16" /LENGTH=787 /DNA_ID=CAMNT_0023208615 /DNA_START=71 /DNA_END=2434 /DNA_ORIENTATION=+